MAASSSPSGIRTFLDTNVLVYAFDPSAPAKQERAAEMLRRRGWIVSWQVIQEFANVAIHRFKVPLKAADLAEYLELVLWPHCAIFPSLPIHRKAIEIHENLGFRYYDSLMVASALSSDAEILYSEDLQHGQVIGTLHIENPFL